MKKYSKFILHELIRPFVIIFFVGLFLFSCSVVHKVEIGLDQTLSMPMDSYVLEYMNMLFSYLAVGAPVYFVVPGGFNYSNPDLQQKICGGVGCAKDSLVTQISTAGKLPDYYRIAPGSPMSWIDDYITWVDPNTRCCGIDESTTPNSILPPFDPEFIAKHGKMCRPIRESSNRLVGEEFNKFVPWFLGMNPSIDCPKGGHAGYDMAMNVFCGQDQLGQQIPCSNNTINPITPEIGATHFMTYHTQSSTSDEFTDSLVKAQLLADDINKVLGWEDRDVTEKVFPYSVFYVFYEQYLTIVNDTITQLAISISAVGIMTFFMLGCDIIAALVVVITLCMLLIDMFGVMYLWNISLSSEDL